MLFLLKVFVSVVFVLLLISAVGITSLFSAIQSIPWQVFVALIVIALITILINALAVWSLYRTVSDVSFGQFLPAFLSSWVAGFLLPGKVGSLSIALLLKENVKPGASAAIFIIDKLITVVLAIVIGTFFIAQYVSPQKWNVAIGLLVLGIVGIIFLFATKAGRSIIRFALGSKSGFFEGFSASLPVFFHKPQGIIANAILTLMRTGIQAISLTMIFASFGYPRTFFEMLSLSSAENLASLIPITISGIGLREVVLATMSEQIAIPFSLGVTAGLIMTIVMLLVVIPGIFAFDEKKLFHKKHA